jgi:hypothetical protein
MDYDNYLIADEIMGLIRWASREPEKLSEILALAMVKIEYIEAHSMLIEARKCLKELKG